MNNIISFQPFLRPPIAPVFNNKDYDEHKCIIERIDRTLLASGVENRFLELSMVQFHARVAKEDASGEKPLSGAAAIERYQQQSSQALRCMVLKNLLSMSYRDLSRQLAMSELYQWFCGVQRVPIVRVPSKSTLNAYAQWLPAAQMKMLADSLTEALRDEERAKIIGLEHELDTTTVWVDSTCLEANIHFPVDWVLLRDGVCALIANIETIRRHGLRTRIGETRSFVREMNVLSMAMGGGSKRKGEGGKNRKKARKKVFRRMKKLCALVLNHAQRYRHLLDVYWQESDLTRGQAEVILGRIDKVIAQLPEAQRQAHERVIGERQVASSEKILSLHESDIHVIVRGKAGARVEYGNSLFLAENTDGYILDYALKKEVSEGDAKWLQERYEGIKQLCGESFSGVVGDRGFESAANAKMLENDGVFNALCPRNAKQLSERMEQDEVFLAAQRRRSQTEGRVGILKNVFLDGRPRAKGFNNRELQVAWAVLTHNLWVVARLAWALNTRSAAKAA